MKHKWSCAYIERKHGGGQGAHKWCMHKLGEFQRLTGCHWTFYVAHGEFVFTPTWKGIDPVCPNDGIKASLLARCEDYVSFIDLIERFAEYHSVALVGFCKYLVKSGEMMVTVGRTGDAIAVKTKG